MFYIGVSNSRVAYHVELDILVDLTLELRQEHEAKGELLSYAHWYTLHSPYLYYIIVNYSHSILPILIVALSY